MVDVRYWLLAGPTPTGPFTLAEVHNELAAGRVTWDTPACVVGGTAWQPLLRTPGLGPRAETTANPHPPAARGSTAHAPPQPPPTATHAPPASSTPTPPTPAVKVAIVAFFAVAILALLGWGAYGVYEAVRPYTPTEVCRKLGESKTAAEAKKFATPRLHPLLDAGFAGRTPDDPNDTFELTGGEVDGPSPGTKRVGFRGSVFVPEAGERVRMEGYFALTQSDGWKADDLVVTGVEGVALPGPVSLADEHRKSVVPLGRAGGGDFPLKKSSGPSPSTKPSGPSTWEKSKLGGAFTGLKNAIGWGGVIVLAVLAAVVWGVREHLKSKKR